MIKIKNVSKKYDGKLALDEVSFSLGESEILALVGENGSGKSTLLRLLAGVYKADAGSLTFNEQVIYDNPEVKQHMLYISDSPFSGPMTTVDDLVLYYSSFYKFDKALFKEYLIKFEVNENKLLSKFSKGMRRRVYLCVALTIAPSFLLLDEAFDGLDPRGKMLFKQEFIKVSETKPIALVIATQSLRDVEDIADSYVILKKGIITRYGELSKIKEDYHSYMLAFKEVVDTSKFTSPLLLSFTGKEKIYSLILKGTQTEVEAYINTLNPIVCEKLNLTFEQLFISEGGVNHE